MSETVQSLYGPIQSAALYSDRVELEVSDKGEDSDTAIDSVFHDASLLPVLSEDLVSHDASLLLILAQHLLKHRQQFHLLRLHRVPSQQLLLPQLTFGGGIGAGGGVRGAGGGVSCTDVRDWPLGVEEWGQEARAGLREIVQ